MSSTNTKTIKANPNYILGNYILSKLSKKSKPHWISLHDSYCEWLNSRNSISYTPESQKEFLTKQVTFYDKFYSNFKKLNISDKNAIGHMLEEFIFYIIEPILDNFNSSSKKNLNIGVNIASYCNMFFTLNFSNLNNIKMQINEKNQDVTIFQNFTITDDSENKSIPLKIPMVTIECKSYLDKTMLDGIIANSTKIKWGNPYCLVLVVTNCYAVDKSIDLKNVDIDQIYSLRKNATRKSTTSFDIDVLCDICNTITSYLNNSLTYKNILDNLKTNGKVLT